ncbi:MAG: riboflavin synthase [Phycisphaeraceae bacterium]|nr:riboflavin synthase [Phycisphaeraceae bacterium]
MFTGLVSAVGTITSVEPTPTGLRLTIEAPGWAHSPALGESIAVRGCCLTVSECRGAFLCFDVVPETLARTTLGAASPGSRCNLEASVTPSTLLGGHLVQGHVDGLGRVLGVDSSAGQHRVRIEVPDPLAEFLTPKGSVAVDGVSLTVAALNPAERWFEVALIPSTLRDTTLNELAAGNSVNLEMDLIAKTIIHWARFWSGG